MCTERKLISKIFLLLLFVSFLVYCSTFPAPKTDNSALLVIPLKAIKKTHADFYRRYIIELTNTDETIRIRPRNGYLFIDYLRPGNYIANKIISLHKKGVRTRTSYVIIHNFRLSMITFDIKRWLVYNALDPARWIWEGCYAKAHRPG